MNARLDNRRMVVTTVVLASLVAPLAATALLLLLSASANPATTEPAGLDTEGNQVHGATIVAATPTPAPTCSGDTWIGGVDNNFGTPGNWSTRAVPGASDDACITATTTTSPPPVAA